MHEKCLFLSIRYIEENQMNGFKSMTRPLIWFMTLAMVAFFAGCLGGIGDTANSSPSSAKAITAYSLSGNTGVINETAKSIAVTVPYGTSLIALVTTYTSTGSIVTVGTTIQTSGTTPNDFTSPVIYIVTAADGTMATYNVTVTVASASAKGISAFSIGGSSGVISGSTSPYAISVTVPKGTILTALIASFTTTGTSVTVSGVTQHSGAAPINDFSTSTTTPVAYTVHAADASTTVYNVSVVSALTGTATVNLGSILTNNFVVLSSSPTTGITDTGSHSSAITGNMGLSPGPASAIGVFCTEMTGNIYGFDATYVGSGAGGTACFKGLAADNTVVANAVLDMGTAYTNASATITPAATDAAHLNVGAGTLTAGMNFTPGTYTWGTSVNVTGDITLTGGASDVWIFQISGDLSLATAGSLPAGTHVILSGGAVASNVFWQVAGGTGVTLGTYSTFYGNILTAKQIILQTGAVLHGRALAQTDVVLDANPVGP
jgi:hypothetical protein